MEGISLVPALTQDQLNQAIQLNRAGGQSYDQGQQMTMEQAIALASQYGAVPQRISSGAADPNSGYSGVWAIPTANGFVPLDRLAPPQTTPTEAWSGGPRPQTQPQAAMPQAQGGPIAGAIQNWQNQGGSPMGAASLGSTPQQAPRGSGMGSSYPPSASGPISSNPVPGGYPSAMSNMAYPGSPAYRPSAQTNMNPPAININIGGGTPPPGQDYWSNANGYNAQSRQAGQDAYNALSQPPAAPQGPTSYSRPDVLGGSAGYGPQAGLTPPQAGPSAFDNYMNYGSSQAPQPYSPTSPDLNQMYQQGFGSMPPIGPVPQQAHMYPTPGSDPRNGSVPTASGGKGQYSQIPNYSALNPLQPGSVSTLPTRSDLAAQQGPDQNVSMGPRGQFPYMPMSYGQNDRLWQDRYQSGPWPWQQEQSPQPQQYPQFPSVSSLNYYMQGGGPG